MPFTPNTIISVLKLKNKYPLIEFCGKMNKNITLVLTSLSLDRISKANPSACPLVVPVGVVDVSCVTMFNQLIYLSLLCKKTTLVLSNI